MNRAAGIRIWRASGSDLAHHYAIRHRVFVVEQRALEVTDIDARDVERSTIHVLAAHGLQVAGTVRLYPLRDGWWQGDRLAVLASHRSTMVGAELVRFAVATAAARGGHRMRAQIQLANVRFFERLGWVRDGDPAPYCGFDHQPMLFDLAQAPDLHWPGRPATVLLEGDLEGAGPRAG
ncbi:MSMEG_0567/Sll0786 family nitrogen starvation N-acetyltransferase [Nocardioides aquiterrae]|uniref:N-acetyltransferase domain-containing protein n=1 Tax=Nocardioides aquiterrae TaxID=203799 RepID=A0ABN1UA73_9ACTN